MRALQGGAQPVALDAIARAVAVARGLEQPRLAQLAHVHGGRRLGDADAQRDLADGAGLAIELGQDQHARRVAEQLQVARDPLGRRALARHVGRDAGADRDREHAGQGDDVTVAAGEIAGRQHERAVLRARAPVIGRNFSRRAMWSSGIRSSGDRPCSIDEHARVTARSMVGRPSSRSSGPPSAQTARRNSW